MRVTTSKSKNSESFYINFAYIDKNGKNTSKTYKKLGALAELSETLSTYYKEIPLDSTIHNDTLIVTYSPKYKAYQENIREGQIERAKALVDTKGKLKKTHRNPNDPARFVTCTSTTIHGK